MKDSANVICLANRLYCIINDVTSFINDIITVKFIPCFYLLLLNQGKLFLKLQVQGKKVFINLFFPNRILNFSRQWLRGFSLNYEKKITLINSSFLVHLLDLHFLYFSILFFFEDEIVTRELTVSQMPTKSTKGR